MRNLAAHRKTMDRVISQHHGRIANTAGDSVLAEFPSVVDAVQCAVTVQERLADANERFVEERRVQFRIGVHVGDVMVKEGDLLGDAINIAARLQTLARPGGICVSGLAHDYVRKLLPLSFDDLGLQVIKNIAEPVAVFAVRAAKQKALPQPPQALPLPDKPSVVVLPFTTGNPEDEYLADGITEDITTALSKMRWLFVIARNSSFAYKGRAIEVTQIARQLGVVYVVTGSLRRSGSHVRISVELAEGETGGSLWAERYDRQLEDMFKLQDEIAEQVAGAIEPELLKKEGQRVAARPTEDVTAWDLVRRGMWHFHKFTPENHWKAYNYFKRAIEAAPESAEGYIWAARACGGIYAYCWSDDPETVLREGMALAARAVQIDDKNPYAHYAMSVLNCFGGNLETAQRAAQRVLAISPSFALGHCFLGVVHLMSGRPKEAVGSFEHGLRLSPSDPQNFTFYGSQALAYYFNGEPEKGLQAAHRALEMRAHLLTALAAIVLCSRALGNEKQASEALEAIKVNKDRVLRSDIITFVIKFNPKWAEQLRPLLGTDEVIE